MLKLSSILTFIMKKMQVTFIGTNSLFGRLSSLLLKQSSNIKRLDLYDDIDTNIAHDLASINTGCKINAFKGRTQLPRALKDADLVVIGDHFFESVPSEFILERIVPKVIDYTRAYASNSPRAILVVAASPVNTLVPVVTETLMNCGCYDCNKVLGCTSVDNVRANAILSRYLNVDPRKVVLPVIGGSSPETRVTIFSQAKPRVSLPERIMQQIACNVKTAGLQVYKVKREPEAINKAYATVRFIHSVMAGLRGESGIAEIALSRSVLVPGVDYFSLPILLGKNGIEHRFGLPETSRFENKMIDSAIEGINKDTEKAYKLSRAYGSSAREPERSTSKLESIVNKLKWKTGRSLLSSFVFPSRASQSNSDLAPVESNLPVSPPIPFLPECSQNLTLCGPTRAATPPRPPKPDLNIPKQEKKLECTLKSTDPKNYLRSVPGQFGHFKNPDLNADVNFQKVSLCPWNSPLTASDRRPPPCDEKPVKCPDPCQPDCEPCCPPPCPVPPPPCPVPLKKPPTPGFRKDCPSRRRPQDGPTEDICPPESKCTSKTGNKGQNCPVTKSPPPPSCPPPPPPCCPPTSLCCPPPKCPPPWKRPGARSDSFQKLNGFRSVSDSQEHVILTMPRSIQLLSKVSTAQSVVPTLPNKTFTLESRISTVDSRLTPYVQTTVDALEVFNHESKVHLSCTNRNLGFITSPKVNESRLIAYENSPKGVGQRISKGNGREFLQNGSSGRKGIPIPAVKNAPRVPKSVSSRTNTSETERLINGTKKTGSWTISSGEHLDPSTRNVHRALKGSDSKPTSEQTLPKVSREVLKPITTKGTHSTSLSRTKEATKYRVAVPATVVSVSSKQPNGVPPKCPPRLPPCPPPSECPTLPPCPLPPPKTYCPTPCPKCPPGPSMLPPRECDQPVCPPSPPVRPPTNIPSRSPKPKEVICPPKVRCPAPRPCTPGCPPPCPPPSCPRPTPPPLPRKPKCDVQSDTKGTAEAKKPLSRVNVTTGAPGKISMNEGFMLASNAVKTTILATKAKMVLQQAKFSKNALPSQTKVRPDQLTKEKRQTKNAKKHEMKENLPFVTEDCSTKPAVKAKGERPLEQLTRGKVPPKKPKNGSKVSRKPQVRAQNYCNGNFDNRPEDQMRLHEMMKGGSRAKVEEETEAPKKLDGLIVEDFHKTGETANKEELTKLQDHRRLKAKPNKKTDSKSIPLNNEHINPQRLSRPAQSACRTMTKLESSKPTEILSSSDRRNISTSIEDIN